MEMGESRAYFIITPWDLTANVAGPHEEKGLPRVRSTDDVVPIEGKIERTEKRGRRQ